MDIATETTNHLCALESEAIQIIREFASVSENPVMLYSIGKDSSVLLHLCRKAFYPGCLPFPLLHVDTTWKFSEMYDFRDRIASEPDINLLVYINEEGIKKNINPIDHGPELHTQIMKTDALKNAMSEYRFDMALAGARRDEEKSRAKERIFSFRSKHQKWDPRSQRPELWNLRNTRKRKGESFRVFPISNWTELDIWLYILREQIAIVPLYFSKTRKVVSRDDVLIMVDDERLRVRGGEKIQSLQVRFRTLGCYPLTGAIQSSACSVEEVIKEARVSGLSERAGRVIDHGSANSMEQKKLDGYF